MILDFGQLMGSPKIDADNSLTLAVNGTFFDSMKPANSTLHPATFDPTVLKGHMLEVYATDYIFNTLFEAGLASGSMVSVTNILSLFNITVTTGDLAYAIP